MSSEEFKSISELKKLLSANCKIENTIIAFKSILIEIAKNKFMYLHPCMRLVSLLLCLLWFSNNNGYTNALLVPLNRNSIWRQFKLRPAECQS
jgi:hypothetical protein